MAALPSTHAGVAGSAAGNTLTPGIEIAGPEPLRVNPPDGEFDYSPDRGDALVGSVPERFAAYQSEPSSMHRVLSTRPPRRLAGIVALVALLAVPVLAATSLTPKNVDQAKLQQAAKLFQDFKAKKLSPEDQAAYRQWRQKARQEQRAALSQRPAPNAQTGKLATPSPGSAVGGAAGSFASAGGTSESCECTATCQTVLVVNGGSIYFEGSGTVAGPSACADAAAEFCGNAVSSFLSHWNCK